MMMAPTVRQREPDGDATVSLHARAGNRDGNLRHNHAREVGIGPINKFPRPGKIDLGLGGSAGARRTRQHYPEQQR